jgi:hypothetical protein
VTTRNENLKRGRVIAAVIPLLLVNTSRSADS